MNKQIVKHNIFNAKTKKLFLISLLPLQILAFYLIEHFPNFIERFYSTGLYAYISAFLRIILGFIPFAIGQLIFFAAAILPAIYLLWRITLLLKKRIQLKQELKSFALKGLGVLTIVYFLFMAMWGLNYHRKPIAEIRHLHKTEYNTADLIELCTHLIQQTNRCRYLISNADSLPLDINTSNSEMFKMASNGYSQLSKANAELTYRHSSIKPMFTPQVYSYLGISGIYSPITGEALINTSAPAFTLPATICHEMAHQIGFAPEDEANYIAYLACINNPAPLFQYSGSLLAMRYAMNTLAHMDSSAYRKLKEKIDYGVMLDIKAHKTFWRQYTGPMNQVSSSVNDIYLKSNRQRHGIESYNLMVNLLVGDYKTLK